MTSDTPDAEDGLNVPTGNKPGIGQRSYLMNPVFVEGYADIRNIACKYLRSGRHRILDIVLVRRDYSRKGQDMVFVSTA